MVPGEIVFFSSFFAFAFILALAHCWSQSWNGWLSCGRSRGFII